MKQTIFNTLEDLGDDDFDTFKWFLQDLQPGIPKSHLENAGRTRRGTTDLIMQFYPGKEAQIMVDVLKKINKNDLLGRFTNISKGLSRNVMPRSPSQQQSLQSPSTSSGSAVSAGGVSGEPTREDFLKYARPLSLDLNTVHNWLSLSQENRKVTFTEQQFQNYPADPERFTWFTQVLCGESLSERCYWEVEWSGGVVVAVTYRDIHRDDGDSLFGANDESWGLICSVGGFALKHKKVESTVSGPSSSRVVGVYLDHGAGTVSFYSVSDTTMSLIHRVQTSFTHALHPGIGPYSVGSTGELCEIW